jgi:glycosyltransferase involved in cell wall biosynthesis
MMSTAPKLLFVVNQLGFFKSHRLPLALAAQAKGFQVHIATAPSDATAEIVALGLTHHAVPLQRGGFNPLSDLRLLWSLACLFLRLRPRVVHLVTIKPVIYGGIAARCMRIPGVIMAISGLGFVFIQKGGWSRVLQIFVQQLYRLATGGNRVRVIFQNQDDCEIFKAFTHLREQQTLLIPGSGVPLSLYRYSPEPMGCVVVTMAARLLIDKGVFEFIAAAEQLQARGIVARFFLAGDLDPDNPSACTADDLRRWREDGVVELLGHCADIPALFSSSHIVVLPSYREGMPKVLLEAAACGRAVVTTDVAGCRDAIEPGITGLLVAARDASGLANAIQSLILDRPTRQAMGQAGRRKAEREFDIAQVVSRHLQLYAEMIA